MSLVDSLLAALVRLDGDALVMHVGEKPYVVTTSDSANVYRGPLFWGQIELSTRTLTVEAVAGMVAQLLPAEQRAHLSDVGAIEYPLPPNPAAQGEFSVIAARGGDDIWLEIRHRRPEPVAPVVAPAPAETVARTAPAPAVEEPPTAQPTPAAEVPAAAEPVAQETPAQPAVAQPEPEPLPEVAAEPVAVAPPERVAEVPAAEPVAAAPPEPAAEVPAAEPVAAAPPEPMAEVPAAEPVAAAPPEPAAEVPAAEPVAAAPPEPAAEAPATEPVAAAPPEPAAEEPAAEPVAAAPPEPAAEVPATEPVAAAPPEPMAEAPAAEPVAAAPPEPVAGLPAAEPVAAVDSVPPIYVIEAEAGVEPEPHRAHDEDETDIEIELDVEAAATPPLPVTVPPAPDARAEREEHHEEEYYDLSPDVLHDEAIEVDLTPAGATAEPEVVVEQAATPVVEPKVAEAAPRAQTPPIEPAAGVPREWVPPSRVEPGRPAIVVPMTRPPIRGDARAQGPAVQRSTLDRLLRIAAARGASALYIVTNTWPAIRVDGEIQILDSEEALGATDVATMLMEMAPEPSREALRTGSVTEWICDVAEVGRVRCMSFQDHRGQGGIFRMLPARALSVEQLGLSREIQGLCREAEGLVLVTGPRSSGKSTLVSAFVDLINRTRADHVITLEGQIKFVHESRRSLVSQRELRGDAEELKAAVRAALREDPDVLVIEDLRSADLIAAALEAAESGRLVFGALPAASTTAAIERMIDQFPQDRRAKVQTSLATTLRGVVTQVLLRKIGGGRVAAREILLNTPPVAALLAEGKTFQLGAALDTGRKHGMAPLNDALVAFVRSGAVAPAEAYRKSADRDGLLVQLRREGVDTSFVERLA